MVMDTANGGATSAAGAQAEQEHFTQNVDSAGKRTSTGRRLVRDMLEIVELQTRIIGLKILSAIQASLLRLGLLFLALIAALAGIVFLYIAAFQALEKVLPATIIFLLFGLIQLLLAVGLVAGASQLTRDGARTNKPSTGKSAEKPIHSSASATIRQ